MPPPEQLVPVAELRNLLVSLLSDQRPAPVVFAEAQPVKLIRPAAAREIVPFGPVNVVSQTIPAQLLPANPTRASAIIRNLSTTDSIVVAGRDGNAPRLSGTDAIGLEVKPGESLTLEITGEVWAIMKNVACKVAGVEIVADTSQ